MRNLTEYERALNVGGRLVTDLIAALLCEGRRPEERPQALRQLPDPLPIRGAPGWSTDSIL
jgi:hypothetical protein